MLFLIGANDAAMGSRDATGSKEARNTTSFHDSAVLRSMTTWHWMPKQRVGRAYSFTVELSIIDNLVNNSESTASGHDV